MKAAEVEPKSGFDAALVVSIYGWPDFANAAQSQRIKGRYMKGFLAALRSTLSYPWRWLGWG